MHNPPKRKNDELCKPSGNQAEKHNASQSAGAQGDTKLFPLGGYSAGSRPWARSGDHTYASDKGQTARDKEQSREIGTGTPFRDTGLGPPPWGITRRQARARPPGPFPMPRPLWGCPNTDFFDGNRSATDPGSYSENCRQAPTPKNLGPFLPNGPKTQVPGSGASDGP